jgi:hypoxanthine phosphoribosyltransferase
MINELETVLVAPEQIRQRVQELGKELQFVYSTRKSPLHVLCLLNGALIFTSDLLRQINLPLKLDTLRVSSYGEHTTSTMVNVQSHLMSNYHDQDVLIIDDILDTGKTLSAVSQMVLDQKPRSLKVCVLLDKKARRVVPFEADFVGFQIPDKFVVGYGLDFAERYRNLPCIGVLKPEFQRE